MQGCFFQILQLPPSSTLQLLVIKESLVANTCHRESWVTTSPARETPTLTKLKKKNPYIQKVCKKIIRKTQRHVCHRFAALVPDRMPSPLERCFLNPHNNPARWALFSELNLLCRGHYTGLETLLITSCVCGCGCYEASYNSQDSPTRKNGPVQNVSSAMIEKPCYRVRHRS